MKIRVWILLLAACFAAHAQPAVTLKTALAERVDQSAKAIGIVAGTIGPEGRNIVVHGCPAKTCDAPLTSATIFEIGSITKVFTALLLADMVERGEVSLDDPVAKYLPSTVVVPERNGRSITLLDLATHYSGLPRIPDNMNTTDLTNPYAKYTAPMLYEFLGGFKLPRDPGESHSYSNLGAGLLGHALSRRAGIPYEELVRRRILGPLGMKDTSITLTEAQRRRLATGHAGDLKPVSLWDFDVLAPAGALRSTMDDMLTFAAAHLELSETPLSAAIRRMKSIRRPAGAATVDQALGWLVLKNHDTQILFHDGGTAGFRTMIALRPDTKRAAVVLANAFNDINDIGLHTLEPKYALAKATPPRKEIEVAEQVLDSYVGEYRFTPAFSIVISRNGARLQGQATKQPPFELFAESESKFFVKLVDAQITFEKDESGAVTAIVLHQGGRDQRAAKVK